ncbi:MAG: MFS transporter [Burkholderiaceae bacterium]
MSALPVTGKFLFRYGLIALPVAFAGFPLYVLAPDFYATHHGLSLTLLGGLLLAIRLFDAVQDPLIGWLTDRLGGRFLTLVALAGVGLCLAVFGLFNGMLFAPAIWFTLCMLTAVSAYSILTIVLGAQAMLWTTDPYAQTRIAGAREAFGLIGLLIAVVMPAALSSMVASENVYLWYGAVLAFLMLLGFLGFSRIASGLRATGTTRQMRIASPLSVLRGLSRDSRRLFAVYGLSMLAASVPAVLVIFYVRDLLGAEHLTGLFLLFYFLSGAVAMPLWKSLSARLGKPKAWALANLLAIAAFSSAFFLSAGDVWPYAIVCIVSGLSLGADLTLPPSILADEIHARGHGARAGTYYAFLAFIAKASLALASVIALPLLDAVGFETQAVNSRAALTTLSVAYALIPCALKLMAAGLLYSFFIRSRPERHHENSQNRSNHRSSQHV